MPSASTTLALEGPHFLLNGRPTYAGRRWRGQSVAGLLLNARMVQAIADEENPAVAARWAYPDTGRWDPARNTREFCAMLPLYRAQGLLAVTVGLQGGGSNYTPAVMDHSQNSAFTADGELKPPYFARLAQVLAAADAAGLVVIVSYFYWAQIRHLNGPDAIRRAVRRATAWLLRSGHRHIIVEIANEIRPSWPAPLQPATIHHLFDLVKSIDAGGRRLPVGCSAHPHEPVPPESWLAAEDITLPHGNDRTPAQLHAHLQALRATAAYRQRPRPLLINEDGVALENFEAALAAGASWGFYHQGFGSDYRDRFCDWSARPRETQFARLSGFQTLPVNWTINDPPKRAFFTRLRAVTGGI